MTSNKKQQGFLFKIVDELELTVFDRKVYNEKPFDRRRRSREGEFR